MGSGVDVGGDGSVEWKVFVENVRRDSIRNCSIGDRGYEQGGVDETDPGDFTISIKMPADYRAFVETLNRAAAQAKEYAGKTGALVSFVLPIEPKNPDQIQVRWRSSVPTVKTASPVRQAVRKKAPARKPAAGRRRGR
jgi:hypothetical protein